MLKIRIAIIFIIILMPLLLFCKTKYLITLKGGTKIKADSYIKENGFVKVFKFGGYIVYPEKNIKKIEKIYVNNPFQNLNTKTKEDNSKSNNQPTTKNKNKADIEKSCNPIVKNFDALHIYNKEKKNFDLKLAGTIVNNCENYITNLKMTVHFYNDDNEEIFTKILNLDDIAPYDTLKFSKLFDESKIGEIKYFNYKLEFFKE